jgi:TolB-like protein
MMMTRNSFRFESFTLDLERMCLHGPSGQVDLRPKSFDVLRFLLERSDRVVAKEELIRAIWPDVTVGDESLTQCISEIRRAMDDEGRRIIRTVPRRGYLIDVPISVSDVASAAAPIEGNASGEFPSLASPLPDRPSVAVLPFTNMSGDPGQEYFTDGMVEDIITGLSRSKLLFVIARTSSFTYKGKAADVKRVGRELGVRYVLEGSVRKASNRVRITGQLIEAATGVNLWADRFDSQLEDVFDLQDQLTSRVIDAISHQLERAEIERAQRKPTGSLQAYDYYLRALASFYKFTREAGLKALKLTEIASGIDPEFAAAYALGARCYIQRKAFGWCTDAAQERIEARRLARRAIELDKDDPLVLAMAGHALAYVAREVEEGAALLTRAINLDRNLVIARHWSGFTQLWLGNVETAIEQFKIALRLSPLDPWIFNTQTGLAFAYFLVGRNEEASSWATTAVRQQPRFLGAQRIMVACHVMSGRVEEAREICAHVMQLDPTLRISGIKDLYRRPEDIERLTQAFRIAGMPE